MNENEDATGELNDQQLRDNFKERMTRSSMGNRKDEDQDQMKRAESLKKLGVDVDKK